MNKQETLLVLGLQLSIFTIIAIFWSSSWHLWWWYGMGQLRIRRFSLIRLLNILIPARKNLKHLKSYRARGRCSRAHQSDLLQRHHSSWWNGLQPHRSRGHRHAWCHEEWRDVTGVSALVDDIRLFSQLIIWLSLNPFFSPPLNKCWLSEPTKNLFPFRLRVRKRTSQWVTWHAHFAGKTNSNDYNSYSANFSVDHYSSLLYEDD